LTGGAPGSDCAAASAQPAGGAPARPPSATTDIEDVAAQFDGLLAASDRLVRGLSGALETARAVDPIDEVEVGAVEDRLAAATELVDLLESAVSVAIRRMEPGREAASRTAPPGTRMDTA
jgi:hypothetical protein